MMPVSESICRCTVPVASRQLMDVPPSRSSRLASATPGGVVIASNTIQADDRGGRHTVIA